MSTSPSYLRTAADGQVTELPRLGHRARPAVPRIEAVVFDSLRRCRGLADATAARHRQRAVARGASGSTPHWRVVAPVPLQTVCVVHEPPGLAGEALDAHTRAWAERVNRSGSAYLTPAILGGRWMVRVSIGAELTRACRCRGCVE